MLHVTLHRFVLRIATGSEFGNALHYRKKVWASPDLQNSVAGALHYASTTTPSLPKHDMPLPKPGVFALQGYSCLARWKAKSYGSRTRALRLPAARHLLRPPSEKEYPFERSVSPLKAMPEGPARHLSAFSAKKLTPNCLAPQLPSPKLSLESCTNKEPKPKLLSPDILRWGRGLPHERVGAKKFGMSLETREIKLFGWDIPGFCWDIPAVPEKFEKKSSGSIFRSLLKCLPKRLSPQERAFFLFQNCPRREANCAAIECRKQKCDTPVLNATKRDARL